MNLGVLKFKLKNKYAAIFGGKKYSSYQAALKDCMPLGYENEAIIQIIKQKGIQARAQLAQNQTIPHITNTTFVLLSTILSLKKGDKAIHVVDFGGSTGGTYETLRQVLDPAIKLYWYVVETKAMVQGLNDLANEYLSFHDDLDKLLRELKEIDIIHTARTIQYTAEPFQILKTISDSKARFKIFNRQSLNTKPDKFWIIQHSRLSWHGGTELKIAGIPDREISYPHLSLSVRDFEAIVTQNNKICYTFEELSGIMPIHGESLVAKNYVAERL